MTEPGIYIGLPMSDYLAIPALSSGGIKLLNISPLDFWARCSWLNPNAEPDDSTIFTDLGEAYHARIVEGRDAFYARYALALDPADYPDALRTQDDLKAACKERELPVGGTKLVLSQRLLEDDPSTPIWDKIAADYEAQHPGKILLAPETIKRIEVAAAMIEKHQELSKCFTGGIPELTVVWDDPETGVRCKCRFDYVKRKLAVDLKSASNPLGKSIDAVIYSAIATREYYTSAYLYLSAWPHMMRFVSEGRIFGDGPVDILKTLDPDPVWMWVFQMTGPAPLARGKIFPKGLVHDIGKMKVREGLETFAACRAKYADGEPWIDPQPIEALDDSGFPAWIGQ